MPVTHWYAIPSSGIRSFHTLLMINQAKDAAQAEHNSWLNDKPRIRKLRRKMDLRLMPLCAL